MSFELVDNVLQVAALGVASVVAFVLALRHRSRRLSILALAYACFSMGTLYYALFIIITGHVPHVFYVSELSWIASWFFCLTLQIARMEGTRVRPAAVPLACALAVAGVVLFDGMMGPSYLISGMFAAALGATAYLSVFRLRGVRGNGRVCRVDVCLLACVALQLCVYLSSDVVLDYTRFNPYFVFDLALTAGLAGLLPITLQEVSRA